MLKIKLAKVGKTNKKVFRIIISEEHKDPYGRALEILGTYNPYTKDFQAKADRVKYWIKNGAQMTATVNNLLVEKKLIEGKKVVASKPGKKKVADKVEEKKEDEAKTKDKKEDEAKSEPEKKE